MLCHNLLVELDDVGQEGECLDLGPHEVHEDLFVEVWVRFLGGGGLEGDGGHDQGDELLHVVVNLLQRSNTTFRLFVLTLVLQKTKTQAQNSSQKLKKKLKICEAFSKI